MRHLYLHVPFCLAKCAYCAFVTHMGSRKLIEPYVEALTTEIAALAGDARAGSLDTVYLGGGTPTMLSPVQIGTIFEAVERALGMSGAEVTVEAHPSTVTSETLRALRGVGATRISFGAESMQSDELAALGRSYAGERIFQVIEEACSAGFDSVNVDLMYGIPGQSRDSWADTLGQLLTVRPHHISLYPLQVEPPTVFGRMQREGRLLMPDDESVVEMYHDACRLLRAEDYEHYEVANWSLPGFACSHNLAYWLDREYFAAGVGAHGYIRPNRTENVRSTGRYIDIVLRGRSPVEHREHIDATTELSERVVLGLRLLKHGLDLDEIEASFGRDARAAVEALALTPIECGELRKEGSSLFLDEHAVPLANEVLDRFVCLDIEQQPRLACSELSSV